MHQIPMGPGRTPTPLANSLEGTCLSVMGNWLLMPMHIRVLVDVPAMLGDIVCDAISREPDLELLPYPEMSSELRDWRRTDPDVIVVSTPDIQRLSNVGHWWNRWPRARIVVIEISGRETIVYELRPHATPLGALSPQQLVAVIRNPSGE